MPLTPTEIAYARHVAANPGAYLDRPGVVEGAFVALKLARGQAVHHANLGPVRYRHQPAATAPDLVRRIHARAALRGHAALRVLTCKGAVA